MVQDKFMFFQNFKDTADNLSAEMRLKFYDALTDYVFYDKEPDDPIIKALVMAFRPSLEKFDSEAGRIKYLTGFRKQTKQYAFLFGLILLERLHKIKPKLFSLAPSSLCASSLIF